MPKEPSVEQPEMSRAEMEAALQAAMEKIAAQSKQIKKQKRNISEMKDAQFKNKTLPSEKMAASKNPKKKAKGKKAKNTKKKEKKKKADTSEEESSEHSDGGWDSDQSESEESEEEVQAKKLDIAELYNAVVEYCDMLMKTTTVPAYIEEDEKEINEYIEFHFEDCKTYAEEKVSFVLMGLHWALAFIKMTMMEALVGDMQTIDMEVPEDCQICGRAEVTLADDESNFREVVFECQGRYSTPCGMVSKCQNAFCFGCSNMPDTWRPADDFYCPQCNTEEKIATSKKIREKQKPVYVGSKPEKPPEKLNAAMQVVNVFGGGGGATRVKNKDVQKAFNYKPSRQVTIDELNRMGDVVKVGDFHESRLRDTPRAVPPAKVQVKFLNEFNPPDAIKSWNNTSMFVGVIEVQIKQYFKNIRTFKKDAKKAIDEINIRIKKHLGPRMEKLETALIEKGVTKIREEMEDLPLNNKNRKNALNRKRNALNTQIKKKLANLKAEVLPKIEGAVKKYKQKEMHNIHQIKKMMANISELMRIVRDTANKTKLDRWDEQSAGVWDFLECDYLKDEEFTDDDESEDDDNAHDDMVNDKEED